MTLFFISVLFILPKRNGKRSKPIRPYPHFAIRIFCLWIFVLFSAYSFVTGASSYKIRYECWNIIWRSDACYAVVYSSLPQWLNRSCLVYVCGLPFNNFSSCKNQSSFGASFVSMLSFCIKEQCVKFDRNLSISMHFFSLITDKIVNCDWK